METEKTFTYPNKAGMIALIANSVFRPFDAVDWYSFAGCESANPLICESEEYSIVIDGNNVNMVYHEDMYGGESYSLHEGY
jgi:hypothetical protein